MRVACFLGIYLESTWFDLNSIGGGTDVDIGTTRWMNDGYHVGPGKPTYIRSLSLGLWKLSFEKSCLDQIR
mgnify:CR=1 FL=1